MPDFLRPVASLCGSVTDARRMQASLFSQSATELQPKVQPLHFQSDSLRAKTQDEGAPRFSRFPKTHFPETLFLLLCADSILAPLVVLRPAAPKASYPRKAYYNRHKEASSLVGWCFPCICRYCLLLVVASRPTPAERHTRAQSSPDTARRRDSSPAPTASRSAGQFHRDVP